MLSDIGFDDIRRNSKQKPSAETRKGSVLRRNNTLSSIRSSFSARTPTRRKIVCVGDGDTGKTALLTTFALGQFPTEYVPTIFDNFVTTMEVDGRLLEVSLVDTAGQEDYDRIRPLMYPDTDCIILCFSIERKSTFDNIMTRWVPELKHYLKHASIILVGCKMDLREHYLKKLHCVDSEVARALSCKIGAFTYLECSAKNMVGIHEVIEAAVRTTFINPPTKTKERKCIYL